MPATVKIKDQVLPDPVPDPLLQLKLYNMTTSGQNSSSQQQVMVELTGPPHTGEKPGYLDLVVVLDVSGSMQGEKLEMMKKAMEFVIQMLTDEDRLAIIKFEDEAKYAYKEKFVMVGMYRQELIKAVNCLEARGNTNIRAGLQMALDVTKETEYRGRVNGILLLSDGLQNRGGDAGDLPIGDRQLDTFGFGEDHDPEVLNKIARNSLGGTFNYVRVRDGLVEPFSQPFAGLHHTVVRDLKLAVRQEKPNKQDQTKTEGKTKKEMVDAGDYKSKEINAGSVTVNFGNLYCNEVRTVIVNLSPFAAEDAKEEIFHVKYSYRLPTRAKKSEGTQYSHAVWLQLNALPKKPDMPTELARRKHVELVGDINHIIKEIEADKKNLAGAKSKLLEANNKLVEANKKLAEAKKAQEREKAKLAEEQKEAEAKQEQAEAKLVQAQAEAKQAQVEDKQAQAEANLAQAQVEAKQAQAEAKLAQKMSRFDFTKSDKMIARLETELAQLQPLLKLERYEKEGRPYALAAETSHRRQRFAARGDVKQKLYRTPAMKKYRSEAQNFGTESSDKEEVTWRD